MTNFVLDTTTVLPASGNHPRQIIVLCHGYGGDGKDISALAINWQRFLPDSIFLCPNAPEVCNVNPQGYQWFDLSSDNEETILNNSIAAEEKLNTYLGQVIDHYKLKVNNLALVGFSQGSMMSIQTGLKKKEKINCLIGYSGKVINQSQLSHNKNSKPKIFLMHGENDTIVPPTHLLESKEYLKKHGVIIITKMFKNCEHRIPVEGSSLGLAFLKKNLL